MGFNIKTTELLINSSNEGVSYDSTLTIGRQRLHGARFHFKRLFRKYGFPDDVFKESLRNNRYCEVLLKHLGAVRTDAIDASDYEQATIIHDMNYPMSKRYQMRYSTVIDGGSLEHIFNFPIAISNCMQMIEVGGHFIGIMPANNFLGHGFYQFSPELLYRVFSKENGFSVKRMLLYFNEYHSPIYEVSDPLEVQDRVKLRNRKETYLFVVAEKQKSVELFAKSPQQSDYYHIQWKKDVTVLESSGKRNALSFARKIVPGSLVILVLGVRRRLLNARALLSPIGDGNRRYFRKVRLSPDQMDKTEN